MGQPYDILNATDADFSNGHCFMSYIAFREIESLYTMYCMAITILACSVPTAFTSYFHTGIFQPPFLALLHAIFHTQSPLTLALCFMRYIS